MIDELLATLEQNAEAEMQRVLTEARAQADAIARDAEATVARQRAARLADRESAGRAALERGLEECRYAARERVLRARAAALDRVFDALLALLPQLSRGATYRARLRDTLSGSLLFLGEEPSILQCEPALANALRRIPSLNGHIRIRPDPDIRAGFRLQAATGEVEVDATLESLMQRLRPQLAIDALAAIEKLK